MPRISISQPTLGDEEIAGVTEVIRSGRLAQGPKVREFEEGFAKLAGVDHAIAVSNGTVALTLALRALDLARGSKVITTPFTFVATGAAITENGMRPRFADIDLGSFNIDPLLARNCMDSQVSAIMPVHLYGLPAEMDDILESARMGGLKVVEDAAQAIGASVRGKAVGSFGDIACFSLYATKNITTGEGGVLTTDDDRVADRLRLLRNQGQKQRYEYVCIGGNFRMTELQAAIGLVQLRRLPLLNAARSKHAEYLTMGLHNLQGIVLPTVPREVTHVWHQYTVRVLGGRRDQLQDHLHKAGIDTGIYYPKGLHQLGLFSGSEELALPNCERAALEVLSLPVHPNLVRADLDRIVAETRRFLEP